MKHEIISGLTLNNYWLIFTIAANFTSFQKVLIVENGAKLRVEREINRE